MSKRVSRVVLVLYKQYRLTYLGLVGLHAVRIPLSPRDITLVIGVKQTARLGSGACQRMPMPALLQTGCRAVAAIFIIRYL